MFLATITKIIIISRPRFWMYVLGSYLIGIGAALSLTDAVIMKPEIIWWLIYFTLPANLFVYGINDLADFDTDKYNNKKGTYEARVEESKKEKQLLIGAILLTNLPFLYYFFTSYGISMLELILLGIFIVCNVWYSLPPLRLKAKPFFDAFSNGIICAAVGLLGYVAVGGTDILLAAVLAGILWPTAMHAFSAIPDIIPDNQAKIKTIATTLGTKNTLLFCTTLYTLIVVTFIVGELYVYTLLLVPYFILMYWAYVKQKNKKELFRVYKVFPYVTYVIGYLTYLSNVLL